MIFRSTEHSFSSQTLAGDLEHFSSVIWASALFDRVVRAQAQESTGLTAIAVSLAAILRWQSLSYCIGLYFSPTSRSIKGLEGAKLFCEVFFKIYLYIVLFFPVKIWVRKLRLQTFPSSPFSLALLELSGRTSHHCRFPGLAFHL